MSLLVAVSAQAQTNTAEPPVVIAFGEGVVKVARDQAWVRIGAERRSKNSKDAQQQNAQAMSAVQQKIAALGLWKEGIKDGRDRPAARDRLRPSVRGTERPPQD